MIPLDPWPKPARYDDKAFAIDHFEAKLFACERFPDAAGRRLAVEGRSELRGVLA